MKITGITSAAILSVLFGITAPAYAQQEQQGERQDHPQQQQNNDEQAKPEQQHAQQHRQSEERQQQTQPALQTQNQKAQEHSQQQQPQDQNRQSQPAQQQRGNERPQRTQEQQRVEQSSWQQHRSQHWDADHRNWQQRGGYHGYRIPEDRFRGYFGPEHGFRIQGLPFLVVGGYPRFQYGGYWVSAVDPWPEYWGMTGTTTTTSTSPTSTTAITCTTADIRTLELRSVSRFSELVGAASQEAEPYGYVVRSKTCLELS